MEIHGVTLAGNIDVINTVRTSSPRFFTSLEDAVDAFKNTKYLRKTSLTPREFKPASKLNPVNTNILPYNVYSHKVQA